MANFEQLKAKYASVMDKIKAEGVVLAHCNLEGDKLFLQGAAPNEDAKNAVWNQIKRVDASYSDLTCDLSIDSSLPQPGKAAAAPAAGGQKYKVEPGDTLSKISQKFYGNANSYQKIADANGIENVNLIKVGQELDIPAAG